MKITATYDPSDNKIRLRADARLPADVYAKVKAAGFAWAPRQELFVAPAWSPEREDLAIELAGEIGDEDTSLAERAEARAERFEGYQDKRAEESKSAAAAVDRIADGIPLGQPILVGHHSERRARKDAEKIENGMKKAVNLWRTSEYWGRRAKGVLGHAEYKEQPDVRARRIKGLEADERKAQRAKAEAEKFLRGWRDIIDNPERFHRKDGSRCTLTERARYLANIDWPSGISTRDLDDGKISAEAARDQALAVHTARIANADRWLEHLGHRLTYERALLAESGYTPPAKKAGKSALPLLNVRGKVRFRDPWCRDCMAGGITEQEALPMTKAQLAAIHPDCKGTRVSADGTYRLRFVNDHRIHNIIFLTDSKEHTAPAAGAPALPSPTEEARAERERRSDMHAERKIAERSREIHRGRVAPEKPAEVAAVEASLTAGVQVVSAPSLFVTPPEIARRMTYLADKCGLAGKRVLEPSAGTGNLVRAIQDSATGADNVQVVAVEINQKLAEGLQDRRCKILGANEHTFQIVWGDFLDYKPEGLHDLGYFHAVLMNPPFDNGADIKHVRHALDFLKPGGVLVGICANGSRQQEKIKPLTESWEELPAGTFAGTNVCAALFVIRR